jgi:hypothetical protein
MTERVGGDPTRVRLGVPAFVSPAEDPWFWQRVAELDELASFVIVDPRLPDGSPDTGYEAVIDLLRARGVPLVGYIDTAYGLANAREVALRTRDWVNKHQVLGVYLDRAENTPEMFDDYASLVLAARCAGAQVVVSNHGRDPHPAFLPLSDVTVTFEGPWPEYLAYHPNDATAAWPAWRQCHLVHGVPTEHLHAAPVLAARRHAETVFFSDDSGLQPWHRLPHELIRGVLASASGSPTYTPTARIS